MKKLIAVLMVLNSIASAQTVIPQALKETLNLAPRNQRGDVQNFTLHAKYITLSEEGEPAAIKENLINYTQLCLLNNADSGLVYQVTIDSFEVGGRRALDDPNRSRSDVDIFKGLNFKVRYRSGIPQKDNCYDHGIPITKEFNYVQGYEFLENFIPTRLVEQLRYSAGRQLSVVGDTAMISLPKPICFRIPRVINQSRIDQRPIKLELAGLTTFRGKPCASIKLSSEISPIADEIYSTDTSSFKATGNAWMEGEYLVTLDKGFIVSASIRQRSDFILHKPDGTTKPTRTLKTLTWVQKN